MPPAIYFFPGIERIFLFFAFVATALHRMRMLGYPPGWLKEAKLRHSGMNLYDSDGQRELDPLEEPGQVSTLGDKDQYDVNKIHDFPGFNVPSPAGTKEAKKLFSLKI